MNNQVAVIFDMDGVISHTNPHHSKAFRAFFSKRNLFPTDAEFAQHMFGKSNSYIMSHFFGKTFTNEELKLLEQEKESLFRELYEPDVQPIDGLVAFINDLHAHGVKLGVATSAPHENLDLILGKIPIRDKFSSILASENVKKHKPDPEVYLSSAQRLGVPVDRCIVFEDSFSGVSAGINAGMKVVGILSSHTVDELPPCDLYLENYLQARFETIQALLN
jgi:beta-phosphoglucomutase